MASVRTHKPIAEFAGAQVDRCDVMVQILSSQRDLGGVMEATNNVGAFGWVLSAPAAALYLSLLEKRECPLAEMTPYAEELDELESKGFVRTVLADNGKNVVALPPEVPVVRNLAALATKWLTSIPGPSILEGDFMTASASLGGRIAVPQADTHTRTPKHRA
jgi:hypothetical protein